MLFEVSRRLAYNYNTVSVIGRNPKRFEPLRRETIHLKGNLDPLILDYTDRIALKENIDTSVERYGHISLVVSWIHSTVPDAGDIIAEAINKCNESFRYFDILGSSKADPSNENHYPKFASLDKIKYRQIVLGFKIEEGKSRWLTDKEISDGVMNAIDADAEYSVIGITKPWDKRP